MKYLKIIVLAVLALFLLLFLGAGLILSFVNPNDYQKHIAEAVERSIGRKLYFEGAIELSYYPWLGLKVGALRIDDLPKFGPEPLLRLREAGLKLDLRALLRGRILVDEVLLDGVELKLAANQAGDRNWDFGREPSADRATDRGNLVGAEDAVSSGGTAVSLGSGPARNFALAINRVRLSNVRVSYEDFKRHSAYVVNFNNAVVHDFVLGRDFSVALDGYFADPARGLHWAYDLTGQVKGWRDSGHAELRDILVKNTLKFPGLPEAGLGAELRLGAVLFSQEDKSLVVDSISLDLPGGSVKGQLKGNLPGAAPDFEKDPATGSAGGTTSKAAIPTLDRDLILNGDFKLESNPKLLLSALGRPWQARAAEGASGRIMEKLNLELVFALKGAALELQKLECLLDNSRLSGTGRAELDKGPRVQAALQLDQLDLDRYLAGLSGIREQSASPAASPAMEPAMEPAMDREGKEREPAVPAGDNGEAGPGRVAAQLSDQAPGQTPGQTAPAQKPDRAAGKSALESMALTASVKIGKLTLRRLDLQNINALIRAENGVIFLQPVAFDFYRGKFNGAARVDMRSLSAVKAEDRVIPSGARNSLNANISQLDAAKLLSALGKNQFLESGTANIKADLNFNGLGWPEVSRSLNGSGSFDLNAAVLNQALVRLVAGFTDRVPNLPEIRRIDSLSAGFKFSNGMGSNPDFALRTPSINASGAGVVNLPAGRLDYRLRVGNIPLIVSGPFNSPSVTVDAAGAVKSILENPEAVRGVLTHPSGVKKGAQEMLRGIFRGGGK